MVRANAFLNERDYVIPADVEDVFMMSQSIESY